MPLARTLRDFAGTRMPGAHHSAAFGRSFDFEFYVALGCIIVEHQASQRSTLAVRITGFGIVAYFQHKFTLRTLQMDFDNAATRASDGVVNRALGNLVKR